MIWQEKYADKILTPQEAVGKIRDGQWVSFPYATAVPQVLMRELVAQKERFSDLHLFSVLALGYGGYLAPECAGHFRLTTTFLGPSSRQALTEKNVEFMPCFFHQVPDLMGSEDVPLDIALAHVSVPDADGWCSIGISCDLPACAAAAKTVIAQVNDQMPRVNGEQNRIHVSEIDWLVPVSDPLPEALPAPIGETESQIGRNCASLVKDGDTLQLGIGAIPDAVMAFLGDKKDLGIHSEVIGDGLQALVESGVVNNSKKTLHPGKIVTTFLMGSKKFYDFVDNNPDLILFPVNYTNDPWTIARNDNMVSINSCIEVDMFGQVNAESMGLRQFSGIGGQVDFVRGAQMSRGGRSIIAMPSTAAGGKVSRIVPMLSPGAAVTTSRGDVHYIVTEYGVARMKGRTLRQRAEALIAISHPDFRESLTEEFRKRFE